MPLPKPVARLDLSYPRSPIHNPPVAMREHGPCINIRVGVHQALAQKLSANLQSVPKPIDCRALVDTGAGVTVVDLAVVNSLGINKSGQQVALGGFGGASHGFTVAISITVGGVTFNNAVAHCHDMQKQKIAFPVILGRDFMRMMHLDYNGLTGKVTLAIYPTANVQSAKTMKPKKKGSTKAQQKKQRRRRRH